MGYTQTIFFCMKRIIPTTQACFSAITAPELYRNFMIHAFVMFPAAMSMCWLGRVLDSKLGWTEFGDVAWRIPLGVSGIVLGGIWVWYVYGYLFLAGGGSPGTHVDGGPVRLVDTGPYTAMRHPSVLGKLLGVTCLGIAWGSTVFLVFFLPILLIYAIVSNKLIQERFCHLRFGKQYEVYCQRVPMLIPSAQSLDRWKHNINAVEDIDCDVQSQPPSIWNEFKWYLLGLIGLIAIFSLAVWVL